MITFIIGLLILFGGGYLFGGYSEKVFGPDDRDTPATAMADGVDFVPMGKWKNSLIQLLNIAGTGPILGPIQGILFGPIAFIIIPTVNVLAGAFHDYFAGMISLRENGAQMPAIIRRYLGNKTYYVYYFFLCLLMLLVGAVFTTTPGDLFVGQVLGKSTATNSPIVWIVYGAILVYYLCATLFPIDAIIGRIYPVFGAILLISAAGIFIGLLMHGAPYMNEFSFSNPFPAQREGSPFMGAPLFPIFFLTVACGIVSGFHSTQATLIARAVKSEKEGRMTFYNMMLLEGFIAMVWAAGGMVVYNMGLPEGMKFGSVPVVGHIAKQFMGPIGGTIAVLGVIVLPITSGDTALRSLRLMIADFIGMDQKPKKNRIMITTAIFIPVIAILFYSKAVPAGFNLLWRYFAWSNQTIAVFAFAVIAIYMRVHKEKYLLALIPGMFYAMATFSYILHAPIGFGLEERLGSMFGLPPTSYLLSYVVAGVLTALYALQIIRYANANEERLLTPVPLPKKKVAK